MRLRWLALGVVLGVGVSLWAGRTVRRAADRYRPQRLTGNVAGALRGVGAEVKTAVSEGRAAMRQREAELRQQLVDPRLGR